MERMIFRPGEGPTVEELDEDEEAALRERWAEGEARLEELRRMEAERDYADRRRRRYAEELRVSPLDTEQEVLGHVVDDIGQAVAEILDHLDGEGTRLPAEPFRALWAKVQAIKAEIPKGPPAGSE